jgi:hypothetical protein
MGSVHSGQNRYPRLGTLPRKALHSFPWSSQKWDSRIVGCSGESVNRGRCPGAPGLLLASDMSPRNQSCLFFSFWARRHGRLLRIAVIGAGGETDWRAPRGFHVGVCRRIRSGDDVALVDDSRPRNRQPLSFGEDSTRGQRWQGFARRHWNRQRAAGRVHAGKQIERYIEVFPVGRPCGRAYPADMPCRTSRDGNCNVIDLVWDRGLHADEKDRKTAVRRS